MTQDIGQFCWVELMTSDVLGAETFYRQVIGWDVAESGLNDRGYKVLSIAGVGVGGLMPIPAEAAAHGARPGWIGYISTPDVDAAAARIKASGGQIHRAGEDIPGVGRFAVVADPQGAAFVLFKDASGARREAVAPGASGHVGWRELHAGDGASAFAFYAGQFGWTKAEAIDMGPMGTYQLFSTGGPAVGGMMTKAEQVPGPFWAYYFNVAALDETLARVSAGGGQIVNGPLEVPGGAWIAQCFDPQGAFFALVAPKR
jgi:predicted enzyme related to lactoylglutathione lyase